MSNLVERWLDHLADAGALIGTRADTRARLENWAPALEGAVLGDRAAEGELLRLVALDARNLAQEGRPASLVVAQPLLLEAVWPEARRLSHLLVRVAADAHALGTTGVHEDRTRRLLARRAPVVAAGPGWLAFLMGPMDAEVLDAIFGRLLQAAAGAGAPEVAIDLSGAEAPDAMFLRTLVGFSTADTGPVKRLTVTSAADPGGLAAALGTQNVSMDRVTVSTLGQWLDRPMSS